MHSKEVSMMVDSKENRNSLLVSIITVAFNESEERIHNTFHSIFQQSWKKKEIVVVDGKSENGSLDYLKIWQNRFDIFISEKDKGIFHAMNKGIRLATGEWLVFMNMGDTFVDANSLQRGMLLIDKNIDILYGDRLSADGTLKKGPMPLNRFSLFFNGICHQSMIIRKSAFSKIGTYREDMIVGGDPDWNMRAFIAGLQFKYAGFPIAIYAGGGLSENYGLYISYRKELRISYFNKKEQVFLLLSGPFVKLINRMKNKNYSLPLLIRYIFNRLGSLGKN